MLAGQRGRPVHLLRGLLSGALGPHHGRWHRLHCPGVQLPGLRLQADACKYRAAVCRPRRLCWVYGKGSAAAMADLHPRPELPELPAEGVCTACTALTPLCELLATLRLDWSAACQMHCPHDTWAPIRSVSAAGLLKALVVVASPRCMPQHTVSAQEAEHPQPCLIPCRCLCLIPCRCLSMAHAARCTT